MKTYQPSNSILKKYADVLIKCALDSGRGAKKGEVVQIIVPDVAKPLGLMLQNTVLEIGAHPLLRMIPTGFDKDFFTLASEDQLTFFPKKYLRERAKLIDHQVVVIADPDPEELKDVDSKKIFLARNSKKAYREWLNKKEDKGEFNWTLGLWGVEAKAKEVGLSLEEYWQQIIKACFLDKKDPVKEWRNIFKQQEKIKEKLNALSIDYVTVKGEDIDLKVKIGANRIWEGGSGCNIPSFEFFTSPDWRGTEGWVKFNQPLYRYGNVVRDISLEFKKGVITKAKARVGNKVLQEMIQTKNANKIGEFSLTDKRMSRITHVMAETLFDENIGGPFGNTHLAIGNAYRSCYRGDQSKVSKKQWQQMGFNDSAEHTDMVSTTNRIVTAHLQDGTSRVIYKDGIFVV